jgi:hypothetical protein
MREPSKGSNGYCRPSTTPGQFAGGFVFVSWRTKGRGEPPIGRGEGKPSPRGVEFATGAKRREDRGGAAPRELRGVPSAPPSGGLFTINV